MVCRVYYARMSRSYTMIINEIKDYSDKIVIKYSIVNCFDNITYRINISLVGEQGNIRIDLRKWYKTKIEKKEDR